MLDHQDCQLWRPQHLKSCLEAAMGAATSWPGLSYRGGRSSGAGYRLPTRLLGERCRAGGAQVRLWGSC